MPVYEETDEKKITKDGRKYYYKCYYVDKYGTRKRKQSKMYKGKRECEKAEREFLSTIQYEDIPDYDISFESVYNEWLEYKQPQVKITTFYADKKRSDKHILEYFKKYKLHSIKSNDLLKWKENLVSKGMATNSNNCIIGFMQKILEYSVNNYNFDKKVANKLQKNKSFEIKKAKESEWNFWTFEEFNQFIEIVNNDYYKLVFTFLYYTGLRIGEAVALNWNDINFEKKTIKINKTLTTKIGTGGYKLIPPKTKNSIRTIDLDDNLIELLKKHYEKEKKIYQFNNNMFIFGNIKYLTQTTLRTHLNKYIKIANIKKITLHGFRHSHASLLIHLGLDFKDVAERLGDTIEMVQSTYYHMFPEKKSNTVNALNKLHENSL